MTKKGQNFVYITIEWPLNVCRVTYNVNFHVVDCVWGSWTNYGECNSNTKSRTRTKTVVEKNGGQCSGSSTESKACSGMESHLYQYTFKKI